MIFQLQQLMMSQQDKPAPPSIRTLCELLNSLLEHKTHLQEQIQHQEKSTNSAHDVLTYHLTAVFVRTEETWTSVPDTNNTAGRRWTQKDKMLLREQRKTCRELLC